MFTPRGRPHGVNVVAEPTDEAQEPLHEPNEEEDEVPEDLQELER